MSSMPPVRHLKHTRAIVLEAYSRDDGLWEIDAQLTDIKTRDLPLAAGVRPAGEPVHDMRLTITYNDHFEVVDVLAISASVPYPGQCEQITPNYRALIGLNLLKGFRQGVKQRLGGIAGCTHLSELAGVLPTAAIQAFAGERRDSRPVDEKPFMLDQCHALRTDGESVRTYYPRWYLAPGTAKESAPGVASLAQSPSQTTVSSSKESHEDS